MQQDGTMNMVKQKKKMGLSVKCMVFYGDELLLLQKKDPEGLLPWEFPGGGLEFGEDFYNAAIREVKEETGLDVALLGVAGLWSYQRNPQMFLTGVIYVAKTNSKDVVLSCEHYDYVWVKPCDLHQYPLQDSLRDALKQLKSPNDDCIRLRSYFCDTYEA